MGIVKKLMAGALAVSFMSLPVAAQATASKLSLSKGVRAGKSVKNAEHASGGFLVPALAIVAVIAGAIVLSDSDDSPHSP